MGAAPARALRSIHPRTRRRYKTGHAHPTARAKNDTNGSAPWGEQKKLDTIHRAIKSAWRGPKSPRGLWSRETLSNPQVPEKDYTSPHCVIIRAMRMMALVLPLLVAQVPKNN